MGLPKAYPENPRTLVLGVSTCPFCGCSELVKDGFAYVPIDGKPSKAQRWQCKECHRRTVNPSRERVGEKV